MENGMGMVTGEPGVPTGDDYGPSLGRGMGFWRLLHAADRIRSVENRDVSTPASDRTVSLREQTVCFLAILGSVLFQLAVESRLSNAQ
jgi:hypothetical protein